MDGEQPWLGYPWLVCTGIGVWFQAEQVAVLTGIRTKAARNYLRRVDKPSANQGTRRKPGVLKGKVVIGKNFDAPLA